MKRGNNYEALNECIGELSEILNNDLKDTYWIEDELKLRITQSIKSRSIELLGQSIISIRTKSGLFDLITDELTPLWLEYREIEGEQSITNSQLDEVIYEEWVDFTRGLSSIYGTLSMREVDHRRKLMRRSFELIPLTLNSK